MAEVKLNQNIFDIKVKNHELLKLAYTAYLANSRTASAKTLKRGEVRGGGKKPWRQKGTGRARFGSTRNPIWRHGGVAFGPTGEQNFKTTLTKNMKRTAVAQALSLANQAKKIYIGADFTPKEGKVKETYAYRDDLIKTAGYKPSSRDCHALLVVPEKNDLVLRATRNISELKITRPTYLNVFDILNADAVIITKSALPLIEAWLDVKEDK
ncbi:MAG: 50S ribosomal protein L4 [Candidatus Nomurabacteria bacterium]|jgi:large subunit ribosomal protein L4|nr:50S ribosomal protein L4 [Candidatus Nomurabacteria bacterium]